MWPWRVKLPTQQLLRLLLLLMLMMRTVLATVCCRFGGWGLVIKLNFCSDFQHKVWVWRWSSGKILKLMFGQYFSQVVVKSLPNQSTCITQNDWVNVLLWGLGAARTTLCAAATVSHPHIPESHHVSHVEALCSCRHLWSLISQGGGRGGGGGGLQS